jgi:(p)ppGpp synthase/HD superfamily hydrolase
MKNENTLSSFAAAFAKEAHGSQKRNDGSDYFIHPWRVAALVEHYKGDSHEIECLKAAAFLHDVLEDTSVTYYQLVEHFGHLIASIVLELTSNPEMKRGMGDKGEYLSYKCKHMTHWALVIKLCDRLDNMSDMSGCDEKWRRRYTLESMKILKYLAENRELTSTHKHIIQDLWEVIKKSAESLGIGE